MTRFVLRMGFAAAATLLCACGTTGSTGSTGLLPIPDKLVVLTIDDGNKSDATFVGPLLKEYGFGASFYKTEGLGYPEDPGRERYSSWEEVRGLHDSGFEIGNHTGSHANVTKISKDEIHAELEAIERRCDEYGIPSRPHSSTPVTTTACPRSKFSPREGTFSRGAAWGRSFPTAVTAHAGRYTIRPKIIRC